MNLKSTILVSITVGLVCSLTHADSLLDIAAQLIPQDPKHPVTALAQNDIATIPQPKVEKKPQVFGTSATGESQAATMDQNGHWKVSEKPKGSSVAPATPQAVPESTSATAATSLQTTPVKLPSPAAAPILPQVSPVKLPSPAAAPVSTVKPPSSTGVSTLPQTTAVKPSFTTALTPPQATTVKSPPTAASSLPQTATIKTPTSVVPTPAQAAPGKLKPQIESPLLNVAPAGK